jgi:hypothetical protein
MEPLDVLRVDDPPPAVAQDVVDGPAEQGLVVAVREGDLPLGVYHVDQGRRVVRHGPESGLALPQRVCRFAPHTRRSHVRADAGQKLACAERLGEVVVGPGVEPLRLRLIARAGGKDDHRQLTQPRIGPDRA